MDEVSRIGTEDVERGWERDYKQAWVRERGGCARRKGVKRKSRFGVKSMVRERKVVDL